MEAEKNINCHDILQFQDTLKRMRLLDDKIIYKLNTSLPTDSFKQLTDATTNCKQLYVQLRDNYQSRESRIKYCIDLLAGDVRSLKQEKASRPDDVQLLKKLRAEQTNLRLLQTELGVEEIIKERTMKVFYERCRDYYNPSDQVV